MRDQKRGLNRAIWDFDKKDGRARFAGFTDSHNYSEIPNYGENYHVVLSKENLMIQQAQAKDDCSRILNQKLDNEIKELQKLAKHLKIKRSQIYDLVNAYWIQESNNIDKIKQQILAESGVEEINLQIIYELYEEIVNLQKQLEQRHEIKIEEILPYYDRR